MFSGHGVHQLILYVVANFGRTHAFAETNALKISLPDDATVLSSDFHEHPLWGVVGQPTTLAYSYCLWSYGLPIEQRSHNVAEMYLGGASAPSLLRMYHVDYVLISPYERKKLVVNEEYYNSQYASFSPYRDFRVYKIK